MDLELKYIKVIKPEDKSVRIAIKIGNSRDLRSIPFGEIKNTIRVFYIYPTKCFRYPKLSTNSRKYHYIFELKSTFSRMPIMIEVRLCKFGFDLKCKLDEVYDWFIGFYDNETLSDYELGIYTLLRKSSNPAFPEPEAYIREYY